MSLEKAIFDYVWQHPLSGKTGTVTRVMGKDIVCRKFTEELDVAELASMLTSLVTTNPCSVLHLNMIPAENMPYGIYLDVDSVIHVPDKLAAPEATKGVYDGYLMTIVTEFAKVYIGNLAKMHVENKNREVTAMGGATTGAGVDHEFHFQALYVARPFLGDATEEAKGWSYKHGCHVYIGEVQAYQQAHIIAFEKAVAYYNSRNADGSPAVNLLMTKYGLARDQVAKVFDPNIVLSRSTLLPGCRKSTGRATYVPTAMIEFHLVTNNLTATLTSNPPVPYKHENLQRFFPIHIGKEAFVVELALDAQKVELPNFDLSTLGEGFNEEENLFGEAKLCNESAWLLLSLLKIIPFANIADAAKGHEYRLKVVNAVTHEIIPKQDRFVWAKRVLMWYFNSGPVPKGVEWNQESHIEERINTANDEGRHTGLPWLKKEAALNNPKAVHDLDSVFQSRNVTGFLRYLYKTHCRAGTRRIAPVSHQEAASLFYKVFGDNYRAVSATTQKEKTWYRYSDDPKPHFSCKKWQRIGNIKDVVMYDIKNTLNPLLDKIAKESETDTIALLIGTSSSFDQYVRDVQNTLGNAIFIGGMIDYFASEYVFSGFEFSQDLDMLYDLTGCLNGILRFRPKPFSVTLLDGNNRELPVSRSLDARYRTDFTDDSPLVKKIFSIFRTIISCPEELDYMLTAAAGIILSGRCSGEKFYILYGSGGDGKTTFMNALVSLAGHNVPGKYPGYGAEGDPRIFQYEKKDPNGHDGGSYHLYGGPRIGNFPEPSGEHPYLYESAIKAKLSGSAQPTRDLNQSSQCLEFRIVPFVLTNDQLEFKGTVTVGGQRRITCAIFTEKFKPIAELAKFRHKKGIHPIDPSLVGVFNRGTEGRDMREALLWILINKYLPRFYDQYGADINAIPLPRRYENITSSFFGRHSNVMVSFMNAKMVAVDTRPDATKADDVKADDVKADDATQTDTAYISLSEFMTVFTLWHRQTQRGSIRDLQSKKAPGKAAAPGESSGPSVRDPWTHEVMHIISSSPLGTDMVVKEGDAYSPIGPNEIIMVNSANLFISGWRWRKDTDAVLVVPMPAAALPAAVPVPVPAPVPVSGPVAPPRARACPDVTALMSACATAVAAAEKDTK